MSRLRQQQVSAPPPPHTHTHTLPVCCTNGSHEDTRPNCPRNQQRTVLPFVSSTNKHTDRRQRRSEKTSTATLPVTISRNRWYHHLSAGTRVVGCSEPQAGCCYFRPSWLPAAPRCSSLTRVSCLQPRGKQPRLHPAVT